MAAGANLTTRLPASKSMAVTPSNTVDLSYNSGKVITRGISVTVAGNITYLNSDGDSQVFAAAAAGVIHPIAAKRIMATGTTATGISAHW